ncbi:MAG: hypothetical protein ABIK82_17305 [Pseudomonadota bacterium]
MKPLRVVVLERDSQRRQELVAVLRTHSVEQVEEAADYDETLQKCSAMPTDLVLLDPPDGLEQCTDLLNLLASLRQVPAVAFYGPLSDVSLLEAVCQRTGLRYLGHFAQSLGTERLRRMLTVLRESDLPDGRFGRAST